MLSHFVSENFPSNTFPQEFLQKECRAKLATVLNQPVARPPPTSSGQKQFLLNHLKLSTVTDLVEMFKSGRLSIKISILERLGSCMRMQNGNEQKRKKLTQPVNRAASATVDNDNIISTSVSEVV